MTQVGSKTEIRRVTVELSDGLEITMYPRINHADVVARWPNGTMRAFESYTMDQLIAILNEQATQKLHDQTAKEPLA